MGSLLYFLSSVVSPAFYFFLLYFCPQSSVFIGDTPGLLSAHGLSLDKHYWKGCLGVSLGLGYLSLFLIFSVAVIFMKIGFETPCFGWIGTPTVLPLLDCWWWFPSRCWHVVAAKDTKIDWEAGNGSRGHFKVPGCLISIVALTQGASSIFRGKKMKNGNDKTMSFLTGATISPFGLWSFWNFAFKPLIF